MSAREMPNGLYVIAEKELPSGEKNILVSKTPDGPGLYWIRGERA